jgi:putative transposase
MGKYVKMTSQQKVQLIEESKVKGVLETARKHQLSYQTLKNWVDAYGLYGKDGLERRGAKVDPELKRLYLENEQLKLLIADKELALRIKDEMLKKSPAPKLIR